MLLRVFALACGLMLAACGGSEAPPQQGAPEVEVAQPIVKVIHEWDEYTGRFEPINSVEVRARVGGFLQSVNFRDGALVNKGDILFVIDPRPFQAAVDKAQAGVMQAQSVVAGAARDVERAQKLVSTNAGSRQAYDDAVTAKQSADAKLLAAQADLRLAQLDVEFAQVTAPISGRISEAKVTAGNLVSGGNTGSTLLATIVSITPVRFAFDVSESAILKYLRLGASGERPLSRDNPNRVQVRLFDETEWTREGHMEFVQNTFNAQTGTLREWAIFDNTDGFLLPGAFGRLRVIGSAEHEAILLPDKAIGSDQSRKIVAVVGADNIVTMKPVVLGPLYEGLRVIRSGLARDERVIINGIQRVRAGAAVTPKPITIEAAPAGKP